MSNCEGCGQPPRPIWVASKPGDKHNDLMHEALSRQLDEIIRLSGELEKAHKERLSLQGQLARALVGRSLASEAYDVLEAIIDRHSVSMRPLLTEAQIRLKLPYTTSPPDTIRAVLDELTRLREFESAFKQFAGRWAPFSKNESVTVNVSMSIDTATMTKALDGLKPIRGVSVPPRMGMSRAAWIATAMNTFRGSSYHLDPDGSLCRDKHNDRMLSELKKFPEPNERDGSYSGIFDRAMRDCDVTILSIAAKERDAMREGL
jgi:hypothetical protein